MGQEVKAVAQGRATSKPALPRTTWSRWTSRQNSTRVRSGLRRYSRSSCGGRDTNPVSQNHTELSRKRERLSVAKAVPENHVAQVCRDMAK